MKINITRLICLTVIAASVTSCKMSRFAYYNFANITDHKIFPSRTATNDSVKFYYAESQTPKFPKILKDNLGREITFEDYLSDNETVAFMIIRDDSIHYENYFNGYKQESLIASFSMAKSVTSILVGCALEDGLIQSVDEPIITYIPEIKREDVGNVTIKQLLDMKSGIKFNESYINPFGDAATYYYGTNLRNAIYRRKLDNQPGSRFSYSSGDTQILGLVLERALKPSGRTVTEYLQEKLWKPLGMEYDATWSLDKQDDGLEKTFCCINARARDFSKIGRLFLNKGNWNGRQIVSKEWVELSTTPDPKSNVKYYRNQWWLNNDGSYMMQGILGQYVYVNPAKNLIIVRLGEDYGNVDWNSLFASIANYY